jgi:carbon storage regulator
MLVLTRKVDETIIIDGRIKVTIIGIRGQNIRVGVEAPQEIPVWREEILHKEPVAA